MGKDCIGHIDQRPRGPTVRGAQVRFAGCLAIVALGFIAGCTGDDVPAKVHEEPLKILALKDPVLIKPGKTARASFLVTNLAGKPAVGKRVDFAAIDDPLVTGNDLAGATLAASGSLTDEAGVAMVTITAGLPTSFRLNARNVNAGTAEVLVQVSEGDEGTLSVLAIPAANASAAMTVSTVEVMLFDRVSCAERSLLSPATGVRPHKTVDQGTPADFSVSNEVSRAVIGQGRDAGGKLVAAGCIEVPANTIVVGQSVRVYLPLQDLHPVPRGSFALTSHFSLARRTLLQPLAAPWQDLADCPFDPAQLWLDCTLDALGSPAGEALDCIPAPSGGGELADLIIARRGMVTGSNCRGPTTADGARQGLEAQLAALFPNPAQPPMTELASLGTMLAGILDDVVLGSTLAVEATASRDQFQATHTLQTATFQVGSSATTVDVLAQGSSQARFVSVSTNAGVMSVDTHRVRLGLGTLAHLAFAKAALTARNWPSTTAAYLDVVFGLASTGTGDTAQSGCAAFDALVCAQLGRTAGCVRTACVAGQAALATRLDAAFNLVDGDGADLQLSGAATMVDDDGDGFTDLLGPAADDAGLWTAQIRTHAGTEILSGSWTGAPQAP